MVFSEDAGINCVKEKKTLYSEEKNNKKWMQKRIA